MGSEEVKRINIKEFREKGYLQELNRQFLHPLGLALEAIINKETGEEFLGGIWDYRNDSEGMAFALADKKWTTKERLRSFQKKADYIEKEKITRQKKRKKLLGFWIEPIPKIEGGN